MNLLFPDVSDFLQYNIKPVCVCVCLVTLQNPDIFQENATSACKKVNIPATEFGRGAMREDELRMWCCGRGLFGAGGVLCSVMSVLGKASSGWALRLSLVSPGGQSSPARPITPALPPRPSSLVKTSLEALRSSFSEELVMVAVGNPHQEKVL